MDKTLRIMLRLKSSYRINSILYGIGQFPILKRFMPEGLYRMRLPKTAAAVTGAIWEVVLVFLGKAIYFFTMVCGIGYLYRQTDPRAVFLHILVLFTLMGSTLNNTMFDAGREQYYAILLMRMDAKRYTLLRYSYAMAKTLVGFLPFTLLFGLARGVPVWVCLLAALAPAGIKTAVAALSLRCYQKTDKTLLEIGLGKVQWIIALVVLVLAYGLPALGIALPVWVSVTAMSGMVLGGVCTVPYLARFGMYREMYQYLISKTMHQLDQAKEVSRSYDQKNISADLSITSHKKGFEFLNELFVRRHRKILWRASLRITVFCLAVVGAALVAVLVSRDAADAASQNLPQSLPYFVFIIYTLHRGSGFTRALFMNCDHSLLTYSFYKQPDMVLRLFAIRLRDIVRINLPPALVLGMGLPAVLYASDGTFRAAEFALILISLVSLSIFFSVHYLTLYYLLQPYNAGTEMRSSVYQIALSGTYLVCFFIMKLQVPTLVFGLACILFCTLYCAVACVLVYRLAPRTFRLRN